MDEERAGSATVANRPPESSNAYGTMIVPGLATTVVNACPLEPAVAD